MFISPYQICKHDSQEKWEDIKALPEYEVFTGEVGLWTASAKTDSQWQPPPSRQISVSSIERGHNTCINVLITENSQLENCPVTTNTQHRPSAQIEGINI